MQPGLYPDLAFADYHAAPGISKSDLNRMARSPLHYRQSARKDTAALRLGRAAHSAVLEPHSWERRYGVCTWGRRSNAFAKVQAASGKQLLTVEDWETCLRIREAVWNHPLCQDLFWAGEAEVSAWWIDPETLLLCKCRPDWRREGVLVELKTTLDASPGAFAHEIARRRYHVQAAYYVDGWAAAGGAPVERFIFIAVEKEKPFAVALYELSPYALERARQTYRYELRVFNDCLTRACWPGYSTEILTVDI